MNRRWLKMIACCVLWVCGAGTASVARDAAGMGGENSANIGRPLLSLRIVPRIGYGGTIYAVVGVQNGSGSPLWLNARLTAASGRGPVMAGNNTQNVWFDIRYGKDGTVTYRCAPPNGPTRFKAGDYRSLRPGEVVDSDEELSCFDLSRLGEYTIVAHYYDCGKSSPPAPKGTVPLNYELVSAPVTFSVMGG